MTQTNPIGWSNDSISEKYRQLAFPNSMRTGPNDLWLSEVSKVLRDNLESEDQMNLTRRHSFPHTPKKSEGWIASEHEVDKIHIYFEQVRHV